MNVLGKMGTHQQDMRDTWLFPLSILSILEIPKWVTKRNKDIMIQDDFASIWDDWTSLFRNVQPLVGWRFALFREEESNIPLGNYACSFLGPDTLP